MHHDEFSILAQKVVARIREVRLDKNLKQEYIAAKMGCSQNSYSKIEIGKTELTVRSLYQIASILGVSAIQLMS
jgi:transcriptional regulator with XRE-family HTH domain